MRRSDHNVDCDKPRAYAISSSDEIGMFIYPHNFIGVSGRMVLFLFLSQGKVSTVDGMTSGSDEVATDYWASYGTIGTNPCPNEAQSERPEDCLSDFIAFLNRRNCHQLRKDKTLNVPQESQEDHRV